MTDEVKTDVVIIGAGIAGLWLTLRLRNLGYSTLLFEKEALGGTQSMRSQGIIHGGTKYSLHGALSGAANAISSMPQRWRANLAGTGEIDLRGTRILSEHHYLWSREKLLSRLTTFFASKAVRGKVSSETKETRPEAFQHADFQGSFYVLNELVLDLPSLITQMAGHCPDCVYQYDCSLPGSLEFTDGRVQFLHIRSKQQRLRIKAQRYILTAGEGNESVLHNARLQRPAMQRRPLHMVLVKHQFQAPVYAHCVGSGSKPLATITTHYMGDGQPLWYIGGNLAETGVERNQASQVEAAKTLLKQILPWINLGKARWSSCLIHRAEPRQEGLMRPDNACIHQQGNLITCWPTKLALAPSLADEVIRQLITDQVTPNPPSTQRSLNFLKRPPLAVPVWEELLK